MNYTEGVPEQIKDKYDLSMCILEAQESFQKLQITGSSNKENKLSFVYEESYSTKEKPNTEKIVFDHSKLIQQPSVKKEE